MKYLFSGIIISVIIFSAQGQDKAGLSNKVYYFGPTIDSKSCKVIAECDCCTDNIIFFNQKEFVKVSYCMADKTVSNGTFQISGDKLILTYKGIFISRNQDMEWEEKHGGSAKSKYKWETEKASSFKDTLTKILCNQVTIYKHGGDEILFGRLDKKIKAEIFIAILKREGFWSKLGLK